MLSTKPTRQQEKKGQQEPWQQEAPQAVKVRMCCNVAQSVDCWKADEADYEEREEGKATTCSGKGMTMELERRSGHCDASVAVVIL